MVRRNNLKDPISVRQAKKVKKLSKMAPLERTGVNQGLVKFFGGYLVGEQGAKQEWHGDALFDGNVRITYSLQVEGDTVIGGSVQITENLDVSAATILRGLTELLNSLTVHSGGRILVDGDVPLTIENGVLTWDNGATARGSADSLVLSGGGQSEVIISLGSASLVAGSTAVTVDGITIMFAGRAQFMDEAVFNGQVFGPGIQTAPLAGIPSGTVVRSSANKQFYVAL